MSLFNKITKTFQWGQHQVRMETGEIATTEGQPSGTARLRRLRHDGLAGQRRARSVLDYSR